MIFMSASYSFVGDFLLPETYLECGDLSPFFWEIEMTQFTHLWPQVLKKAATSRRTPKNPRPLRIVDSRRPRAVQIKATVFALKGLLRGEPQIFAVRLFVRPCVRPCVPLFLGHNLDRQICNIALKEAQKGPKRGPGWDISLPKIVNLL